MKTRHILALLGFVTAGLLAHGGPAPAPVFNCYQPIAGGWEIRIPSDPNAPKLSAGSRIGVVEGNARLHRRPLFPPADKTLVWTADELKSLERYGFRPLVLAYNEPRFLFDFHSAGGLLGHLQIGLTSAGASKWFHRWSELTVRYVDGRMEYTLTDKDFPGVVVTLVAIPLADSAGLAVKVAVSGLKQPATLVWAYGGGSAFFTAYSMDAPEFRFRAGPVRERHNSVGWAWLRVAPPVRQGRRVYERSHCRGALPDQLAGGDPRRQFVERRKRLWRARSLHQYPGGADAIPGTERSGSAGRAAQLRGGAERGAARLGERRLHRYRHGRKNRRGPGPARGRLARGQGPAGRDRQSCGGAHARCASRRRRPHDGVRHGGDVGRLGHSAWRMVVAVCLPGLARLVWFDVLWLDRSRETVHSASHPPRGGSRRPGRGGIGFTARIQPRHLLQHERGVPGPGAAILRIHQRPRA